MTSTIAAVHNPDGVSHIWYTNVVTPVNPVVGTNDIVPFEFTVAVPLTDGVIIVGNVTKVPPIFPGPSFSLTIIITVVFNGVTVVSLFATGGLIDINGLLTVITKGTFGHGNGSLGAHTSTKKV